MDANDYQILAMRTSNENAKTQLINKAYNPHSAENDKDADMNIDVGIMIESALGLSGEVGELNDEIKKWIFHEKEMDWNHFQKELGDICWYIAAMCYALDLDFDTILKENIKKLQKRYPNGFDVYKANNRADGDV